MQPFFKLLWTQIVNFFKAEMLDLCKEAFKKGLEAFKETVWAEVKDEVHLHIKAAMDHVETYVHSAEAMEKEEAVLNTLLERIKLPLIARPFKKLIKNMIRERVNALIDQAIVEAKAKLG